MKAALAYGGVLCCLVGVLGDVGLPPVATTCPSRSVASREAGLQRVRRRRDLPATRGGAGVSDGAVGAGAGSGSGSGAWLSMMREGLRNGCASGLATACAKTVLQPFDSIKTVQQATTERLTVFAAASGLIARSGSLAPLYAGLWVNIIGAVPSVFVYFAVYQYLKRSLAARWAQHGRYDSFGGAASIMLAAAIGNLVASFLRPPYEIIKQQLQAGIYPDAWTAIASIYQDQGFSGFWQGLTAQIVRDIPYAMITLLVYETLQTWVLRQREVTGATEEEKGTMRMLPFEALLVGALAGGTGSFLTNPMDVVKTRMMTISAGGAQQSFFDTTGSILRDEGYGAFMKGVWPRLFHKIPANACFFLCYEFFRKLLGVSK